MNNNMRKKNMSGLIEISKDYQLKNLFSIEKLNPIMIKARSKRELINGLSLINRKFTF